MTPPKPMIAMPKNALKREIRPGLGGAEVESILCIKFR
jgi:hypothetical protein